MPLHSLLNVLLSLLSFLRLLKLLCYIPSNVIPSISDTRTVNSFSWVWWFRLAHSVIFAFLFNFFLLLLDFFHAQTRFCGISSQSRMQDFARRGKERLEPEEAPLEPFLRDPSGKNLSHTEGASTFLPQSDCKPSPQLYYFCGWPLSQRTSVFPLYFLPHTSFRHHLDEEVLPEFPPFMP